MKNYAKSLLALMLTATMALSASAPAIAVSDAAPAATSASSEGRSDTVAAAPEDTVISENNKAAAVASMEQQINSELLSQTLPQRMNSAVSVTTRTETVTTQTTVSDNSASAGSSLQDSNVPQENEGGDTSQEAGKDPIPFGIFMSELYPGFATGDTTTPDSFPKDLDVTETPEDYIAAKYGEEFRNRPRASVFPTAVDNSKSEYFPLIDSQGGIGSCTCWSQVYYQFTYTYNKSRGIKTTPQNTCSPMFTYSHINSSVNGGTNGDTAYTDMKKFGCATMAEVPYGNDFLSWSASGNIFRNAANRRVKDYHYVKDIGKEDSLITSADDSDLDALKTILANGDIISMTSGISYWRCASLKNPGVSGINEGVVGEEVVLCNDGANSGHRMTIVGYNDKIWTDINNNNQIDNGEMGAFKIANSWGTAAGNKGFHWMSYDSINYKSVVQGATVYPNRLSSMFAYTWIEVIDPDYEPRYFVNLSLTSNDRSDKRAIVTAKWSNEEVSTEGTPANNDASGTFHSYDGTQNESTGVFVWDVSYLMDKLGTDQFHEVEWSVEFKDEKANGRSLTVKDAYFYDEKDPSLKFRPNVFPFTLENSSKKVTFNEAVHNNAIIYYRGYKDPVIRYRLGSTWSQSSGEKMKYTLEEYGYQYKYVIPLGSNSTVYVMFGDGNGRWDNNNGNYFKAVKNSNCFITKGVGEPMVVNYTHYNDDVTDLGSYDSFNATTTGGYPPYKYKLEVYDLNDGSVYYSNDYGKESAYPTNIHDGYFRFNKESKFKVIVYSKDVAGTVASASHTVTIKDMPYKFFPMTAEPSKTVYQSGEKFVLTASNENDRLDPGNCNFTFTVYKDGIEKSRMSVRPKSYHNYKNKSIAYFDVTAGEAGKYTVVVSRTSMADEMAFTTFEYEVAAPALKLSSVTVSPEKSIGVCCPVTVKAAATGGSGTVTYSYSLCKYGAVIQTSDNTSSSAVLTMPAETGPCTIMVTAKDSNGTQACVTKDIWVNPVFIKSINFPNSELYNNANITIGSTVVFDSGMNAANYVYTATRGSTQTVLKTNADKTATLNVKDTGEYTIRLDIKSGDKVLTSMSRKLTLAENPVPSDHKITVAVISYIENEGNQGNYKLHYWNNGGFVGDATLISTGQTISRSVGGEYWGGSSQTFKVYEAHVPTEATGFKFHIGDRWFGGDGSIAYSNTVFIFNYSGDKAIYTTT